MAYKHGHFVWFELVTPDINKGTSFYPAVAGLGTMEADMGTFKYSMLTAGEAPAAGVVNPQMEGVPSQWVGYLSVDDVDAKAAAVAEAGGSIIVPAFDIPTIGRAALVADPEGASFYVFKAGDGNDTPADAFHWMELWAKDAANTVNFYTQVFGYTVESMEMPMGTYYVLKAGDDMVAGIMNSTEEKAPPMWLPYLAVDDCDAATSTATDHAGQVFVPPMDVEGIGRFSVLADNSGAVVGLIKPASQA